MLAFVSSKARRFFRITKHLPVRPSPEWFREHLQWVARTLKTRTSAQIALCSLVPIGEDPSSTEPFQSELNRRIAQYSQVVKEIAHDEAAYYIAVYEAMMAQLRKSPGQVSRLYAYLREEEEQWTVHGVAADDTEKIADEAE